MLDTRVLLLALAMEATPTGENRLAAFRKRKTAYVAALALRADEYEMYGLIDAPDGVDVLWRRTGSPRPARCGG